MGVPAFGSLQSAEEVHRLVFAAVCRRRPIAAVYGGESRSGPQPTAGSGIWRCLSLKKLTQVELLNGNWRTEPHAPQHCIEHVESEAEDHPDRDPQNGQ
jgi:hypothetical protein